jgi:hypothetical protein
LKGDQSAKWPIAEGREGGAIDLSRTPDPKIESQDMIFLEGITDGWYAVTNAALGVGFGLRYPADVFKVLWYWQVYRGGRDYPWWSATYNMALEPCVTMPVLRRAAEAGEALNLGPGESREVELLAVAFEGLETVSGLTPEGKVLP